MCLNISSDFSEVKFYRNKQRTSICQLLNTRQDCLLGGVLFIWQNYTTKFSSTYLMCQFYFRPCILGIFVKFILCVYACVPMLAGCLPSCLPACLSVCLSVCLSACLPACLLSKYILSKFVEENLVVKSIEWTYVLDNVFQMPSL
jgi:hypothetical protein